MSILYAVTNVFIFSQATANFNKKNKNPLNKQFYLLINENKYKKGLADKKSFHTHESAFVVPLVIIKFLLLPF